MSICKIATWRWTLILVATFTLAAAANAQTVHTEAASARFSLAGTLGFEVDALPFATGGYYGSAWYGSAPWRLRAVVARVNVPGFATQPQFEHLRLDVTALIVDRFIGKLAPALAGHWVGIGVESWHSRIEAKREPGSANFDNLVATAGGGYVWKFSGNTYLNPWGAVHQVVGGDREVSVGGRTYHPSATTWEVSLKLGWHF